MDISTYLVAVFFILTSLCFVAVFIYYRYIKSKHTRERFAFFSVRLFTGFIISILTLLFARNPFFSWTIEALNRTFNFNLPPYRDDSVWSSILVLFICVIALYMLITTFYNGWEGKRSTRQIDKETTKSNMSVLQDAMFYYRHREKIEIYEEVFGEKKEIFTPFEKDTRKWTIKAAEFLKLYDNQYSIDIEKDWYREASAYIGTYGREGKRIGILCSNVMPSDRTIDKYFTFLDKQGFIITTHIVAVKGKQARFKRDYKGIELEYRFEEELLDSLINFNEYKTEIVKGFDEIPLENSDLTLADIYVSLAGQEKAFRKNKFEKVRDIESVEKYIIKWINSENKSNEHLAILGEYGQGKSVLTKRIVKKILEHPEDYTRIPILIELRGLSPRNQDVLGILSEWTKRYNEKAKALWELHKAGKLLIILDGFDEMDLVGDTELLFAHFGQLWTLASTSKSKIIITGRPNLFADDAKRREALGIVPPRVDLPYTKAIYLNPLDKPQLEEALRDVKEETREGILEAYNSSGDKSSFKELISRPSTLYQLSTVWNEELAEHKERLNSALVIGNFLKKTYERQEKKKTTVLTAQERHYFTMGIAVGMMLHGSGNKNKIGYQDLREIVRKLWNNYPEKLPPYEDALQGNKAKDFLPNRLKENKAAFDTILKDVHSGGVLTEDLSGRDTFRFAHKSYLELLISVFYTGFILQNEHKKTELMIINSIAQALDFRQGQLISSPDIERFSAEHIVAQIELKDKEE